MKQTALIIGGAGFVGHYLSEYLHDTCGYFVYSTKMAHETLSSEKTQVCDLNILEKEEIRQVFCEVKPDYIFHLAAQSSVAVSWKNPQLTVDVNIKGCINLLEVLKEEEYRGRVLLVGSGEEYGMAKPEEQPIKEDVLPRPGNIYAATKACQCLLGQIYAKAYNLDLIMVRAFNHVGPGQLPQFVVADFCSQVAAIERGEKSPQIHVGNLSAKRDFLNVRDVVRAYAALMQKGKKGEIYNVGSGHAIEIGEILNQILSLSSVEIEVKVDEAKFRPVDVPVIEADITKLKNDTGWEPTWNLADTLTEILNEWRK